MDARRLLIADPDEHRACAFYDAEAAREQQGEVRPTFDKSHGSPNESAGSAVASLDELTEMTACRCRGMRPPVRRPPYAPRPGGGPKPDERVER